MFHPGMLMGGMPPPMMGPGMGMMGGFGGFNPRSMPGWFGRDLLGREFSGPGGLGHSTPYRPPDPSVLPPMPSGLPIMARPPKEGFDAYGRKIPPTLPAGIDGWGRSIPGADGQLPFRPPGMPGMVGIPGMGMGMNGMQPPGAPELPADLPGPTEPVAETGADIGLTSDSGRPEEPPMFYREPVRDDTNDYRDFPPFSFESTALARIHRLRRPPELRHCDVRSDEWAYFIEALEQEAYRYADKSYLSTHGTYSQDDLPLLTEDVHQLLRAWQVGYFGPRGVHVYPAKQGKRLFAPGLVVSSHRGYGKDTDTMTLVDYHDDDEYSVDSRFDPREEAIYSARERVYRRRQRRNRRRELREKRHRRDMATDDWEMHFAWMHPTAWRAGMKPLQYGEKRPPLPRPQ